MSMFNGRKNNEKQVYIRDVSQGNVVEIPTRLRVRQPGVQIPAEARSYCVLQNVHNGSESQSEPFAGLNWPGRKFGHLHLRTKLRMSGAIHLLPLYAFKASVGTTLYLVHSRQTLTRKSVSNDGIYMKNFVIKQGTVLR